jgi:Ulp1 family protease
MEKLFIYHLDGFHDRGNNNTSLRRNILAYIQDDFLDKLNEVFITSNFESIQEGSPGFTVPNQYDGNSCGIRVILCALMFLRGDTFAPDSFEDVDMNDMRLLLASMVVKGSVVPDQENGTSSTLPDGFPPFLYQDSPPSRPND